MVAVGHVTLLVVFALTRFCVVGRRLCGGAAVHGQSHRGRLAATALLGPQQIANDGTGRHVVVVER